MAKRSKGKNIKSHRRRGSGTRTISEPILLFVQGECTEKDYFELLKDRLKLSSLTIKVESQSPENLIDRTKTTISRDKDAPFSAIYYVVDVDNTRDEQFRQAFKAAKKATNRKTEYHFVVSHESFEDHISSVNQILQEINAHQKPMVMIFNKIDDFSYEKKDEDDLTPATKKNISLDEWKRTWMAKSKHPTVFISAITKENFPEMKKLIYDEVHKIHISRFPYNDFLFEYCCLQRSLEKSLKEWPRP